MSGLKLNRIWIIILAIGLTCTVMGSPSRAAPANPSTLGLMIGDDPNGGGSSGIGDPDEPTAGGKTHVRLGRLSPSTRDVQPAGDGHARTRQWWMKMQLLMQTMQMRWFGI